MDLSTITVRCFQVIKNTLNGKFWRKLTSNVSKMRSKRYMYCWFTESNPVLTSVQVAPCYSVKVDALLYII